MTTKNTISSRPTLVTNKIKRMISTLNLELYKLDAFVNSSDIPTMVTKNAAKQSAKYFHSILVEFSKEIKDLDK